MTQQPLPSGGNRGAGIDFHTLLSLLVVTLTATAEPGRRTVSRGHWPPPPDRWDGTLRGPTRPPLFSGPQHTVNRASCAARGASGRGHPRPPHHCEGRGATSHAWATVRGLGGPKDRASRGEWGSHLPPALGNGQRSAHGTLCDLALQTHSEDRGEVLGPASGPRPAPGDVPGPGRGTVQTHGTHGTPAPAASPRGSRFHGRVPGPASPPGPAPGGPRTRARRWRAHLGSHTCQAGAASALQLPALKKCPLLGHQSRATSPPPEVAPNARALCPTPRRNVSRTEIA